MLREERGDRALLATMLALAFVMNMTGRGVTETFAVFLRPVEADLGVSRAQMLATYSIYMLVHGFAAPFAGQLVDRRGARATYALGLLALGGGYAAAAAAPGIWVYAVCVGVLGGLGASALGMVVASSLLSRWFSGRLGAVMSLPYAAIGAGMLLLPPVSQLLLEAHGWRTTHLILGCGVLALMPLIFLLPLGRMSAGSPVWQASRTTAETDGRTVWPLGDALQTRAFWGLFAAYFATATAAYSLLPQSVAYLIDQGFEPLAAAGAFGLTGALSVVGILSVGWLSDRFGRRLVIAISYVSSILGALALLLVAAHPSWWLVYAFILFFGLMQGVRGPIIAALVATLYRGGAVGSIFGAMSLALGLGAAFGSWASGVLHDLTGAYHLSFGLSIAGSVVGLCVFVLLRAIRIEKAELDAPLPGVLRRFWHGA